MSFYEIVKVYPEGSASVSRIGLTAKRLGYKGIIICNREPEAVFCLSAADKLKGLEIIQGAEAPSSTPRNFRNCAKVLRGKFSFISVFGATEDLVRLACDDPQIDLLIHPAWGPKPLGIASARAAQQNQVAIGFDLSPLIQQRGPSRARWLESIRRNLELARKFDLSLIITSGSKSYLDLRSPRDLLALARVVGFESKEAEDALMKAGEIVRKNKRNWQGPGVEVL